MGQFTRNEGTLPWVGGLDTAGQSMFTNPGTARMLRNIHLLPDGRKVIRPGLRSYFTTSAGAPQSISATSGAASLAALAAKCSTEFIGVYSFAGHKVLWQYVGGQLYATTRGRRSTPVVGGDKLRATRSWTQFGPHLLFATTIDTGKLYTWGGSGPVVPAQAPPVSLVSTHYNRVIGAGDLTDPTQLYISFVGNPNDWAPSIISDPDAGGWSSPIPGNQRIVSISPSHYDSFYVGTENAMHAIVGRSPSEYQHKFVSGTLGNMGHKTLKNIAGSIVGWNDVGCYSITDTDRHGGIEEMSMGYATRKIFKKYAVKDTDRYYSVVYPRDEMYITFMPHRESSNMWLAMCYYYAQQSWTWWEFPAAGKGACVWDEGHDPILLITASPAVIGYLQSGYGKDFKGQFNAMDYRVTVQSQQIPITNRTERTANLRGIRFWARRSRTNTISVEVEVGGSSVRQDSIASRNWLVNSGNHMVMNEFELDTDALERYELIDVFDVLLGGNGRWASFKIDETDAEDLLGLELIGFELMVNDGTQSN